MCFPECFRDEDFENDISVDSKQLKNLIHRFLRPRNKRDPTFSIILGCIVALMILFWILYLSRDYIRVKLSYYKLIFCNNQCCDDFDDEEDSDQSDCDSDQHFRCFSRSGYKDCLVGRPSPPPPYEDPPSYSVALNIEQEEASEKENQ